MKRILILIALLIVLSPSTLFASFNKEMGVDQELIDQAILGKEMLFNRQYGQALKLFSRLEKEYSDSPTGKGGKMAVWQLKMFENEDFRFKSQYEKAAEDFNAFEVKRLRQGDVPVWDLFVFGAADGMMGFFRSRESKWLSALKKALHATRMLKQLKWKAPDFIDADMGFGSYEYWQSAMTQRIKILPFFKDNRQEGIRLLNEVVKKGVYAKDLARANLVFIYSNEKDYVRAAKVADELISKYPNNIIIRFLRAEIYFDTKDYDNALKLFQKIYAQDSGITRSLLFQGVIFYKQKKFDESKAILEKYVSLDKNKIWNAVGLYWLGRVAEKKKDIPLARHYYNASIKKDGFKPAKKRLKALR